MNFGFANFGFVGGSAAKPTTPPDPPPGPLVLELPQGITITPWADEFGTASIDVAWLTDPPVVEAGIEILVYWVFDDGLLTGTTVPAGSLFATMVVSGGAELYLTIQNLAYQPESESSVLYTSENFFTPGGA